MVIYASNYARETFISLTTGRQLIIVDSTIAAGTGYAGFNTQHFQIITEQILILRRLIDSAAA